MLLLNLTIKRLLSRKLISTLLIVSIGISTMLLVGVQKLKHSAKDSFAHSISGTDLIVGARSGPIQLLLYTVFRQGQPTAMMSWSSAQQIHDFPEVDWVVPISLGDSHRGFAVLGTNNDYFRYYRFGKKQQISFLKGTIFQTPFDVVLGSKVAKELGYRLQDTLYLSHGVGQGRLSQHTQQQFKVVGILKPTGTPIDKTIHTTMEGITAIHAEGLYNKPIQGDSGGEQALALSHPDLQPEFISACFVGLHSKLSIFHVQQRITNMDQAPLSAIIPGVSLSQLWSQIYMVDISFMVITVLVVIIALIGLLLALFMSLHQRKQELAIMRTLGAHPLHIAGFLFIEALIMTALGILLGLCLLFLIGIFLKPILENRLGLVLPLHQIRSSELYLCLLIMMGGVLTSLIPATQVYRKGLQEGFVSL